MKDALKTWRDIFPKKTYRWSIGKWKDAQHCWSSEKCKTIPQWDITSCLSEWLSSKNKKMDTSYTVGGDKNWYSYYGKHYGILQKIKNTVTIKSSNSTPRHLSEEKWKKLFWSIYACKYSLHHYLKHSAYRGNLRVHQKMNG